VLTAVVGVVILYNFYVIEVFAFKPGTQTNNANPSDLSNLNVQPSQSSAQNNTQSNNQEQPGQARNQSSSSFLPMAISLYNGSNIRLQPTTSGNVTIDFADGIHLEVSMNYKDVNGTVMDLTPRFKALKTLSEGAGSWPPLCYAIEDWAVPELGLIHRAITSP
jgi:hypothetical protein